MASTLAAAGTLDLLSALLFVAIGWLVGRRAVSQKTRRAAIAWQAWWVGIGAVRAVEGARNVWAALGDRGPAPALALLTPHLTFLALGVALWGLLSYLVFLYTGRDASLPLGVGYGGLVLALWLAMAYARPASITVDAWTTRISFARPLPQGTQAAFLLFLFLPQTIGAAAYLALYPRVDAAAQRYRIALVAGALLAWQGSTLVAVLAGWNDVDAWQVARRTLSVGAALVILAAYRPPPFAARRLAAACKEGPA